MKLRNYKPLSAALSDVYAIISEDHIDPGYIVEWASSALRDMDIVTMMEPCVSFHKVENHTAPLPCGMKYGEMIMYKEKVDSTDIEYIKTYISEGNGVVERTPDLDHLQNPLGLEQRDWKPMRAAESNFNLTAWCSDSPVFYCRSEHEFTVKPQGYLITSLEKGFIAVSFYKHPTNEDGEFLIPDDETVIKALVSFVMSKIWEKRWNNMDEGAERRMRKYEADWEVYQAKAHGSEFLPDTNEAENLRQTLVRLGTNDNVFYSGFGNLANGETMNFHKYTMPYGRDESTEDRY